MGDRVYNLASIDIPGYFKKVLNMNISEIGFTSGLPFVFAFVTQIMGSYLAEFMINKGYSMTTTRKFLTAVGFLPTMLCLCLVGFIGCNDFYLSVGIIIFLAGMANFSYAGYGVNVLDLSPRFAGIIESYISFVASLAGVLTPLVTGFVTNAHPTRFNYQIVFLIAAAVLLWGLLFYCFFASGEEEGLSKEIVEDESIKESEGEDDDDGYTDELKHLLK